MFRRNACFLYTALPQLTKVAGEGASLPKLDFDYKEGVAPVLSPKQVELHYTKHHKAYVDKLNALDADAKAFDGQTMEAIMNNTVNDASKKVLFNQAAQHFNHSFYWKCLTPNGAKVPADLEAAIAKEFGSFADFKTQFEASGVANFGSGWTWLVYNTAEKKLAITNTGNAAAPTTDANLRPLFTVDVWEHAYYADFQNRRPDYLKDVWGIVNWNFVAENLKRATTEQ